MLCLDEPNSLWGKQFLHRRGSRVVVQMLCGETKRVKQDRRRRGGIERFQNLYNLLDLHRRSLVKRPCRLSERWSNQLLTMRRDMVKQNCGPDHGTKAPLISLGPGELVATKRMTTRVRQSREACQHRLALQVSESRQQEGVFTPWCSRIVASETAFIIGVAALKNI